MQNEMRRRIKERMNRFLEISISISRNQTSEKRKINEPKNFLAHWHVICIDYALYSIILDKHYKDIFHQLHHQYILHIYCNHRKTYHHGSHNENM